LYANPEIEKTLHQLKRTRIQSEHAPEPKLKHHDDHAFDYVSLDSRSSSSHIDFSHHSSIMYLLSLDTSSPCSDNIGNRTLKELAAPDVTCQPLCIQYPELDADFELKYGLIHLLPKFHCLADKDPHNHLKEFHIVCSTMKPHGIDENHIKIRAFPFSLDGKAKDWLYYLQPTSII